MRFFTPQKYTVNDGSRIQENILLFFGFSGVLVSLYSILKWGNIGETSLVWTSIGTLVSCLLSSVMVRMAAAINIAVNIILTGVGIHAANMIFQSGGLSSNHIFWVVAILILAYLVGDNKTNTLWSLIVSSYLVWLLVKTQNGFEFPEILLPESAARLELFSGYLLPLIIIWVSQRYSHRIRVSAISEANQEKANALASSEKVSHQSGQLNQLIEQVRQSVSSLMTEVSGLKEIQGSVSENSSSITAKADQLDDSAQFLIKVCSLFPDHSCRAGI